MKRNTQLIVALDVDTLEKAERLVNILYPTVSIFKIGSQLFTGFGPEAVKRVSKKGAQVFLDLKFHDIPNTVYQTVSTGIAMAHMITSESRKSLGRSIKAVTQLAVFMMTVHTSGGKEMLEKAMRGASEKAEELKIKRPFIVGVTRLTSENNKANIEEEVVRAARLAKDVGLDGVVCSVGEAVRIREECGNDFLIVTPGIRPKDYPSDDQARVSTASEAIAAGADFIVVGRPIIQAKDPLEVARDITEGISCS